MELFRKYILVLCSVALLFPTFVSLAHISAHQNEKPCANLSDTHFHEKSFDCELCDFRLTNLNTFTTADYTFFLPKKPAVQFFNYYQFLSDYQKLSFELRGPPVEA